jgi:prepilin-type N-terminal cleavage/methylation domain-containing protein
VSQDRIRIMNDKGVSLVEVMIALVVLLLVFMGLLQAALLGIDHNMRNILRDEGVAMATSRMEQERSMLFDNLASDTAVIPSGTDCPATFTKGTPVPINIRSMNVASGTARDFCIRVNCVEMETSADGDCTTDDADTKQITVSVGWRWKGEDYTHTVSSLRRRPVP